MVDTAMLKKITNRFGEELEEGELPRRNEAGLSCLKFQRFRVCGECTGPACLEDRGTSQDLPELLGSLDHSLSFLRFLDV